MAADLGAYLQRTSVLPWAWGAQDCSMWMADWCLERWGVDPLARWRGRYADEAGAQAILGAEGGLLAVVAAGMTLPRKEVAAEGDVGVIDLARWRVGAIWTGAHWAFRTPRGISLAARPALGMWGGSCRS